MRHICLALLMIAANAAVAQDWALRAGDVPLSRQDLQEFSDGVTLTYSDDGTSKFSPGGSYSYTYARDGGTAFGRFRITDNGRVCIDFRNGGNRCDVYVRQNGLLVRLNSNGARFPVKLEMGLER